MLRILNQLFETERPKRSLVGGRGTSIQTNNGTMRKSHITLTVTKHQEDK